jgi:hypothetical protein
MLGCATAERAKIAFDRAAPAEANERIEAVREAIETRSGSPAFSYELFAPRLGVDAWFGEQALPRLIYFLSCRGLRSARAPGVFVSLFTADGLPMQVYVQKLAQATDSFPLLAVPFFIFAGVIMNHAGITRRLLNFADALVGHMMGGLAQANVLLSTLMGGLSASANADAAMQAKMLGGDMVKRGYSPAIAAAVTACSSVITPIIPPGIGLIIYGFLADVSIGRLFIAGLALGSLAFALDKKL